jgi:hypothetical protein
MCGVLVGVEVTVVLVKTVTPTEIAFPKSKFYLIVLTNTTVNFTLTSTLHMYDSCYV